MLTARSRCRRTARRAALWQPAHERHRSARLAHCRRPDRGFATCRLGCRRSPQDRLAATRSHLHLPVTAAWALPARHVICAAILAASAPDRRPAPAEDRRDFEPSGRALRRDWHRSHGANTAAECAAFQGTGAGDDSLIAWAVQPSASPPANSTPLFPPQKISRRVASAAMAKPSARSAPRFQASSCVVSER